MNPPAIILVVLTIGAMAAGSNSGRPTGRSESFAGCAMPSYPTQQQIDDCHAWQREKHQ